MREFVLRYYWKCSNEQKMQSFVWTIPQTPPALREGLQPSFHRVKFPFVSLNQAELLEEFCPTWPGEITSDIMVGSSASQYQPPWPGALHRVCLGPTSYEVVSHIPAPALLQELMGLKQSTWTWVLRLALKKKNNPQINRSCFLQ